MRIPLSHYILSCSTDEDGKFGAVVGCSQQSRPGNIGYDYYPISALGPLFAK
jgi:hypothetical protein